MLKLSELALRPDLQLGAMLVSDRRRDVRRGRGRSRSRASSRRCVASSIRKKLTAEGALMIVEPMAGDSLKDNLNPVGRVYYAYSTAICVPCSLAQNRGLALGAQAGEARLTQVLREGGFGRVRRAAETPFNMVLEARP